MNTDDTAIITNKDSIVDGVNDFIAKKFNTVVIPHSALPHNGVEGDIDTDKKTIEAFTCTKDVTINFVGDNYIISRATTINPNPSVFH
jgi:hypothetical protein